MRDTERALRWLQHISYYRLSAYFLPFKNGDYFHPGVDFNTVAGLYIFDRKLRLQILDAVERVEVAMRTALTYQLAHAYGSFGYADPANFAPQFDHARFMNELAHEEHRSRETFVRHYRAKYTSEACLPVWMASEPVSLGTLSRLYRALHPSLKQPIAEPFGVHTEVFGSWLHCLTYVRNVCAHHKRLWNRQLAIRPKLPSRSLAWPHQVPDSGRLYAALVVLRHLLRVMSPNSRWRDRLLTLLDEHPGVSLAAMGFPENWQHKVTWRE